MSRTSVGAIGVAVVVASGLILDAGAASAAVDSSGSHYSFLDVSTADATVAATVLNFGNLGVLSTAVQQQSTITVTATDTTPYNVGIDAGTGTGSTVSSRFMNGTAGNTGTVSYRLLQAPGGANWGNTQGTDTLPGIGSGAAQDYPVYGIVPQQTAPAPDVYTATLTVTVYF